jgi:CubicO group peptidase (beta-lactamase class C family)
MKKSILILTAILGYCLSGSGQQTSSGIERFVDSLVLKNFEKSEPGAAVGIIRNGEVIYMKPYGISNLTYNIPVTVSTKFNLASCSKQFTSACCLLLEQQGKLNLDEDIRTYLPDLPDFGHKITVRNLIHHTSGIPTTDVLQLFNGTLFEKAWSQQDDYNLICRYAKLNFNPNDEHLYSNSGYFLLAKIIEKVTGKKYSEYLQETICKPLNMKNTLLYDEPGLIIPDRATGYTKNDRGFIETFSMTGSVIGHTNQYTSIEDMLIWDKEILNGNIFGNLLKTKFITPVDTLNNGDTIKYTYGFNVWKHKGVKIVEHSGYTAGALSRNDIFPDNNLAVVVLSNNEKVNVWEISMGIADKLLNLKEEPKKEHKEISIDKKLFTYYSGTYQIEDGIQMNVVNKNDTLWLLIPGAPELKLLPESTSGFFLKEFNGQCTFSDVQQNKALKFVFTQDGTDHPGIRIEKSKTLTDNELMAYAGNYRNEILGVSYPVSVKDNKLLIILPESFPKYVGISKEMSLTLLEPDHFYGLGIGQVDFVRDKKNQIIALNFKNVGRVRNIEFQKVIQ